MIRSKPGVSMYPVGFGEARRKRAPSRIQSKPGLSAHPIGSKANPAPPQDSNHRVTRPAEKQRGLEILKALALGRRARPPRRVIQKFLVKWAKSVSLLAAAAVVLCLLADGRCRTCAALTAWVIDDVHSYFS